MVEGAEAAKGKAITQARHQHNAGSGHEDVLIGV